MKLLAYFLLLGSAHGCTNYLVTPGASADGSTIITYSADSAALFGALGFLDAAKHEAGTPHHVWDWDSGSYLGSIPEVESTLRVVANTNEKQLTIGETTFGGLPSLAGSKQADAVLDYGSLIWTTLQRAHNASEAIEVMDTLMQTHGYRSEGESFSIGDPHEAWIMEVISKGEGELGSVWVASRVPDGWVGGHANQARTRTFARDDPANVRFSADVVSFAVRKGLYDADADPLLFSFSDVYDPVTFLSARVSELRVFSFFAQVADNDGSFERSYEGYVSGQELTNRMPLFVQPASKVSLNDTMWYMRAHYEGFAAFDQRNDGAGAGPFLSSYRYRGLTWSLGNRTYHNERTPGTQQSAWHFAAQSRAWLPDQVGALTWFGVDDASHSVYVPNYVSVTAVSQAFADPGLQHVDEGEGSRFDFDRAFWIFNSVASLVYTNYARAHPIVSERLVATEADFFTATAKVDAAAAALVGVGNADDAVEMLTNFSSAAGDRVVAEWNGLFKELLFRFREGSVVTAVASEAHRAHPEGMPDYPRPAVSEDGYPTAWKQRVVDETGDRYLVPDGALDSEHARSKLALFQRY